MVFGVFFSRLTQGLCGCVHLIVCYKFVFDEQKNFIARTKEGEIFHDLWSISPDPVYIHK